jgi:GAF domain-containing protein
LIAGELHADKVMLSRWVPELGAVETLAESGEGSEETAFDLGDFPLTGEVLEQQTAVQVMAGDPRSDSAEVGLLLSQGYRSLIMVPVVHRGESLGIVEAMSEEERPWTRTEINRARIIANQLASVIQSYFRSSDGTASPSDRGSERPRPITARGSAADARARDSATR